MTTKTILVLANSLKRNARCIAGREVVFVDGTPNPSGGWIRPVNPPRRADHGQLFVNDVRLPCGRITQVLDVVTIPFTTRRSDPGQPENWEILPLTPWTLIGSACKSVLPIFAESPNGLWLDKLKTPDRISTKRHEARINASSLALIGPVILRIFRKPMPDHDIWRGLFTYQSQDYNLKITDDTFTKMHASAFPINKVTSVDAERFLCISLGRPYQAPDDYSPQHYKLIAAII
jgi:hypothetical protein